MMYQGGWASWSWTMLMPLMPLVWTAVIGFIVWAAVALTQSARRPDIAPDYGRPRQETPQEILDRRFVSGEIDADAYVEARDRLAGRRPLALAVLVAAVGLLVGSIVVGIRRRLVPALMGPGMGAWRSQVTVRCVTSRAPSVPQTDLPTDGVWRSAR